MEDIIVIDDPKEMDRDSLRRGLDAAGVDARPVWLADGESFDASRVRYVITSDHVVRADIKDRFERLEAISMAFTGVDGVDVHELKERGVALFSSPDYATQSVAELNLGLAVSLVRRLPEGDRDVRDGTWDLRVAPGRDLASMTVGIVGTGAIGRRSADLFGALGSPVVGWSRSQHPEFVGRYVRELDRLFEAAEVVVLCLPLTSETRGIVDRRRLLEIPPPKYVVNTARSELVDAAALADALEAGVVLGAAWDVFDNEPLPAEHPLQGAPNIQLTPHIGFKTAEALERLATIVTRNLEKTNGRLGTTNRL